MSTSTSSLLLLSSSFLIFWIFLICQVRYQNDVRRFKIDVKNTSFDSFCELLSRLVGVHPNVKTFKWKDDENDEITISNELEWNEAIRATLTSQTKILKIRVVESERRISSLSSPTSRQESRTSVSNNQRFSPTHSPTHTLQTF
jgi:hypothetical protein